MSEGTSGGVEEGQLRGQTRLLKALSSQILKTSVDVKTIQPLWAACSRA